MTSWRASVLFVSLLWLPIMGFKSRDCGYVETLFSFSNLAALDVCGVFSNEITNPITGTTVAEDVSFMYTCNADGSAVDYYLWNGNSCGTLADAIIDEEVTDDPAKFNCGGADCSAVVTLKKADDEDCETITGTYFSYPYVTNYCVNVTDGDMQYSEYYSCSDESLTYREFNDSDVCLGTPTVEELVNETCVVIDVTINDFIPLQGSFLYSIDVCNSALARSGLASAAVGVFLVLVYMLAIV